MDKLIVNVDKETLTQMMADPIYANYFDIENQIKHRWFFRKKEANFEQIFLF